MNVRIAACLGSLCRFALSGFAVFVIASDASRANGAEVKMGVTLSQSSSFAGYTLVFPLRSRTTYLVDLQGRVVHDWKSQYTAGQEAYLLPNGNLLRAASLGGGETIFVGASQGGRIQEFTWDGKLIWNYKFHDEKHIRHHAITPMPGGNVMMIVWERKTAEELIAAGVRPASATRELLIDSLYEVEPQGKTSGKIVWQWHLWDHMVQDVDKSKANFGDVREHPELVDANFDHATAGFVGNFARLLGVGAKPPAKTADAAKKAKENDKATQDQTVKNLQGIGYVGQSSKRSNFHGFFPDWVHINGVSYNAKFDQIMISSREFSEVWIIDHSTTTAEAASHQGGRYKKGGDLLYRFGNPRACRAGTAKDQRLFNQHDAQWIADGLPGAGHMLVFNNGSGRPHGNYSSIDEVVLPVDKQGNYAREGGKTFKPADAFWSYKAAKPSDFYAPLMGGAQRLPNGNALACTGFGGEIFEVTAENKVAWRFVIPHDADDRLPGFGPPGTGPAAAQSKKVAATDSKKAPGDPAKRPVSKQPAFNPLTLFFGGAGGAATFRAYRYAIDFPAFQGKNLTPGKTMVELANEDEPNESAK